MENKLQVNSSRYLSTLLSKKEIDLAFQIWHVNELTNFPVNDIQIDCWAKSISELMPDVSDLELKEVINKIKTNELDFDIKTGVRSLFKAIKSNRGIKSGAAFLNQL